MNVQNVVLNLIVYSLPIIAATYIFAGIKLLKQKVDGHFNYFSALMFLSGIYALGYFLSLNSLTIEMMVLARDFENLGVIFIPTVGILFIAQFVKKKLSLTIKHLLCAISGVLWIIYITNPLHHWSFSRVELFKVNGFAVAVTTKNIGYYLILAYYFFDHCITKNHKKIKS
jgi:hypothetical protein